MSKKNLSGNHHPRPDIACRLHALKRRLAKAAIRVAVAAEKARTGKFSARERTRTRRAIERMRDDLNRVLRSLFTEGRGRR